MKKKIVSLVLSIVIATTSFVPAYAFLPAQERLKRPVIDDIWHDSNSVVVMWYGVPHAKTYKIYRSTSKDGDFNYYASTSDECFTDYNVKKGVRYYYKLRAAASNYKSSKLSKWRSSKIPKPKAQVSTTVYITETGSKYHRYGCQYLWNSCYSISKKNAIAQGYTACSRCW